ncbi:hypothetical protein [Hyunsoonleella pacifica]|uniref:Uncharacterized protein n=1 Tax=Hyunsoonleella pacifica TaxID=1080224 RepID=A0A4Q9FSH4_9FLAO|nr:hypothetical protein [Hyunsoonleella pacifica]TBN17806.1 hypothetical protein EYD46_05700 [Hyunsoonleella pacifica]GGD08824.1 hypothetical protein GCM10011368_08420 [Hyunsoonleella pacifica]
MIDSVLSNIELTKNIFRKLIVTSNYKKTSESTIGWDKYSSGIFKNLYAKEYESLIRNRQYSFLLKDDLGFIQFYYKWNKYNVLEKLKMAYYPYPLRVRDDVGSIETYIDDSDDLVLEEYYYDLWNILNHNFELNVDDENLEKALKYAIKFGNTENKEQLILGRFESKYEFTNSSHLRIDYDSKVTSHHKTEIQIGAINDLRLPLNRIISPFTFFDFISKNIFRNDRDFIDIISSQNYSTNFNNSKKLSFEINPFEESNIYVSHL